MQIIFDTSNLAQDFSNMNDSIFPDAPDRCPFKDCSMPVSLKKHGYYSRYFISKSFSGILYIRRYICPVCGKTVSMLPIFCLQYFQYSALDILNILNELYLKGMPLNSLVKKLKNDLPFMDRRTVNYYRKRLISNRKLIQYGLNLISPEFILAGAIPENQDWIKVFLQTVIRLHPHVFLCDFSKLTGKSFLTSNFMIA